MKHSNNESAVSPVIGVVLMVAITVILAAVIASFVFSIASDIPGDGTAAVVANQHGNTITVMYYGSTRGTAPASLVANINGTSKTFTTPISAGDSVSASGDMVSTGEDHVVVIAEHSGGSPAIVLDTYV